MTPTRFPSTRSSSTRPGTDPGTPTKLPSMRPNTVMPPRDSDMYLDDEISIDKYRCRAKISIDKYHYPVPQHERLLRRPCPFGIGRGLCALCVPCVRAGVVAPGFTISLRESGHRCGDPRRSPSTSKTGTTRAAPREPENNYHCNDYFDYYIYFDYGMERLPTLRFKDPDFDYIDNRTTTSTSSMSRSSPLSSVKPDVPPPHVCTQTLTPALHTYALFSITCHLFL